MTDREEKWAAIMATARSLQAILDDEIIPIDTIVIEKEKVTLSHGSLGESDYREIHDIYIDDKTIKDFLKSLKEDEAEDECDDDDDCDDEETDCDGKHDGIIEVHVLKCKRR